jgi:hypothetical protein
LTNQSGQSFKGYATNVLVRDGGDWRIKLATSNIVAGAGAGAMGAAASSAK